MNPTRQRQIEELFEAALELPTDGRAAFLETNCGDDAELRREVEALLASHDAAGPLDRPVARLAASLVDARIGERRIGPYRVLRELGRGGMGVVYLAERDDGQYRRRVAVKLVRSGLDDGQIHRRFLAERQILASLSHPNIAQLLEGGITDGQLPYLVMEYVEGLPITAYCDKHRLGIEARLRLFQQVCAAVHHAHQNLIIHRDLKPSNIVVDGRGSVKLLDFGIAKLLNPSLAPADAPFTRLEQWVMTPEYASPEQVRDEPLTTASDIYSLGVILYELLTGHRPYRVTSGSPEQILELVCERDPERPSSRAGRTESVSLEDGSVRSITPALITAARATSVERLPKQLRGDLDAIVMMALRKEPARRYGSAEMLSQDLQRHLEGLPVLAHDGSRAYRARKFLRRHRAQVVAASLVGVSLLVGTGVASWQASVAGLERDRAEAALAQAEQVTDFLMELFDLGEADVGMPAADVTARDLVRRGAAQADELVDQPVVQARMLDVIGRIYHSLGQFDEARSILERAVSIRRASLGPAALEVAESLIHLSWVHRSRAERDTARRLVSQALEIRRQSLRPDHPDIAQAVYELGWLASGVEQEQLYREALSILERANALPEQRVRLLQGISTNLRRQGRLPEAIESDREALRLAEVVFGPDDAQTGYAMIHLADHVRDTQQDLVGAEQLYRRGLALLASQFGENHVRLIHGFVGLGTLQSRLGNSAEAEHLYRQAVAIRVAATGPDHPSVAGLLLGLAGELERQDRLADAETVAREALLTWDRALGPRHPSSASTIAQLASILFRQGRPEEADRQFQEALDLRAGDPVGERALLAEMLRAHGRMLLQWGRHERAEEQLLRSLAILEAEYRTESHPNIDETKRALMQLYGTLGRPELVERFRAPAGEFVAY